MERIVEDSRKIVIRTMFAAALALVAAAFGPAIAAELVMFEQEACPWCERWHAEVGEAYANSEEGARAPLRRVDIHDAMPQDLAHIRSESFTPTFVLVEDGTEIGRIRGYPGADFFWWMIGELMEKLDRMQKAASVRTQ